MSDRAKRQRRDERREAVTAPVAAPTRPPATMTPGHRYTASRALAYARSTVPELQAQPRRDPARPAPVVRNGVTLASAPPALSKQAAGRTPPPPARAQLVKATPPGDALDLRGKDCSRRPTDNKSKGGGSRSFAGRWCK